MKNNDFFVRHGFAVFFFFFFNLRAFLCVWININEMVERRFIFKMTSHVTIFATKSTYNCWKKDFLRLTTKPLEFCINKQTQNLNF